MPRQLNKNQRIKRWIKLAFIMPAALSLSTGLLPAHASEPAVTIPWQEFQQLYAAQQKPPEAEKPKPRYSIQKATFDLQPSGNQLTGTIKLQGDWLAGQPQPIRLFSNELAVTDLVTAKGGAMVTSHGAPGYKWLAAGSGPFSVELVVAINRNTAGQFDFAIPSALSNRLRVKTNGDEILEGQGLIPLGGSEYSFASRDRLNFSLKKPSTPAPLGINVVSHFTVVAGRLQQKLWLLSNAPQQNVAIEFDSSMTWLKTSDAKQEQTNQLVIGSIAANSPLALQFERPWLASSNKPLTAQLPTINNNRGEQGLFVLGTPLSGQLITTHTATNTQAAVPSKLKALLPGVMRLQQTRNPNISLQFQPYRAVAQPALIVDSVSFFSSYTDDGRQLSTLRLNVPKNYGSRLSVPPVAEAEIWSLTVNGLAQPLYQNNDSGWVIPLPQSRSAMVELSWVQQRERLGLHGKLPLNIPPLGLAARSLSVVMALPERLELLSMESDLAPATASAIPNSVPLNGSPRFFSLPFYRGKAITASLYYREPVDGNSPSVAHTSTSAPQHTAARVNAEATTSHSGWEMAR